MALSNPNALALLLALGLMAGAPALADDTCRWANDGECDDPGVHGAVSGLCAPGTDTADCGMAAVEPTEPPDAPPFSDACPSGTVLMNGSCVDENLAIEEEEPPANK